MSPHHHTEQRQHHKAENDESGFGKETCNIFRSGHRYGLIEPLLLT